MEFLDCQTKRCIKRDLFEEEKAVLIEGLQIDVISRFKYMEKLSHSKTEPNHILLKKMMIIMQKLPQKYQSYMERALCQL